MPLEINNEDENEGRGGREKEGRAVKMTGTIATPIIMTTGKYPVIISVRDYVFQEWEEIYII